jgi:hypothetical protein
MQGIVLEYDIAQSKGVISGDDQNRYVFYSIEYKSASAPQKGSRVDFKADGESAVDVYLLEEPHSVEKAPKKRSSIATAITVVLGIFFTVIILGVLAAVALPKLAAVKEDANQAKQEVQHRQ